MMNNAVLLGAFCIFFPCSAVQTYSQIGYIFMSPRVLKKGESNELHFRRFDNTDPGNITIQLFYKKTFSSNETLGTERSFVIQAGESDVVLYLPLEKFPSVGGGRLEINGKFGNYNISGKDKVTFSTPPTCLVIIQTDKPLYQPGQTVKFRILKVDKDLKPISNAKKVDVDVIDPKGIQLYQFKDINLDMGIVQHEFTLSNEPALGHWRIIASTEDKEEDAYFDVKEYVLPKFDVNIKIPSFVLASAEFIPIEICAKYTYGKSVAGKLYLNASLNYYWHKTPTVQEVLKIDGCYTYSLNVSRIEPDDKISHSDIHIKANVVEDGTGVERTATKSIERTTDPLNLEFTDQRDYYKPGLPFNGKLKVSNPDNTPAAGEPIEICGTIVRQRILIEWWASKKLQFCKNYTSDVRGIIEYILISANQDEVSIALNAKSTKYLSSSENDRKHILSQPRTSTNLKPFFSPSGSFIQLQPIHQPVSCGSKLSFKLLFTAKGNTNFKFYYQVTKQAGLLLHDTVEKMFFTKDDLSQKRGHDERIVNGNEIQFSPPLQSMGSSSQSLENDFEEKQRRHSPYVGEVDINIDVDLTLSSSLYVLVYYIRDDRETVADSQYIDVAKCFKNKVNLSFKDKVQQPGKNTSIQIVSSPNSLCGIKAVDKSISLLDNRDQLTKDSLFKKLKTMDTNDYFKDNPCDWDHPQPGLEKAPSKMNAPPGFYGSTFEDSFSSFQKPGFIVISDLVLYTRPCIDSPRSYRSDYLTAEYAVAEYATGEYATGEYASEEHVDKHKGSKNTASAKSVRDYFPETWLFEMEMTGSDGIYTASAQLPDTITQWIGSAVCINSKEGLGISDTAKITAFQAFFMDYTLPVSAIRGEEFVVVVSVFNYADENLPITVSFDNPQGFEVLGKTFDGDYCVQPDKKLNLPVTLKATKIGKVNITVRAETSKTSTVCGNSATLKSFARDEITKPIEIEAEGFPAEKVINTLFCPSDRAGNDYENAVSLDLPYDVVPDSSRAYMDFTGNVMGQALNNLDRLVALPTGCGEQNMVKFTPNYMALDYLKSIGELREEIYRKAISNLNEGYHREFNYRHKDGSFSAFGTRDPQGSMFLTAFVLRSFFEAKRYITVDDDALKEMQKWIVYKQTSDGCFPNVGKIVGHIEGGLEDEESDGSISAYVLASLYISHFKDEKVTNAAFSCLDKNPPSGPYSKLLYAYAEALAGRVTNARRYIDEARQRLNTTDGTESFIIVNSTEAIDIETDAYAILTTLAIGGNASDTLPYVRYLTTHLNPYGGFKSTQDTCVGLAALAQFAQLIYRDRLNLIVDTSGDLQQTVHINDKNKLLVQRFRVSKVPSYVNIKAHGAGCGLSQTSLRYNTKIAPEKKKFSLNVSGQCSDPNCTHTTIKVLVSYLPPGQKSGMSIVEIKLITGFVADKSSLDKLKSNKSNNILRIDVESNTVIFYFDSISNSVQTFSFQAQQVVKVNKAQPSIAKVYDYYANENSAAASYVVKDFNSVN